MTFKSLLPDRSGRKVTLVGSWRAAGRHNAVLGRAHGMADLLWRVPQWQSGKKKHESFMVFRGNIVTGITGNTYSGQGMLFGTFLMKNIFIDFPTHILNHHFLYYFIKKSMIFIGFICTV